jgi:SAM-dependent methyltransferase
MTHPSILPRSGQRAPAAGLAPPTWRLARILRRLVADLPIELGADLSARLARSLDTEGKIPRGLEALGPLAGRDVALLDGSGGLRARQLIDLGARLSVLEPRDAADLALPDASVDALVSAWTGFRRSDRGEIAEADRVLRPDGRLLVLHDYGRDDVSRLRGDLPEYGAWSRRDGWFLSNGFKIRVIHCFWTFESLEDAQSFLADAFGEPGAGVAATLRRPRLSYNVAIYHRSRGDAGQASQASGSLGPGRGSGVPSRARNG